MREIQFKEKDRQLWWFLRHGAPSGGDKWIYKRQRNVNLQKMNQLNNLWNLNNCNRKVNERCILNLNFYIRNEPIFFQVSRKMQWLTDNIFSLNTKLGQNESFAIRSSPQTSISTSDDASVDKSWRNFWIWIKWIISCACFAAS